LLRDFDLFGTRFLALLILLQHFDGFFLFAGKKNLKNSKKNVMSCAAGGIRVSALATLFAWTSGWGNEGLGYFED